MSTTPAPIGPASPAPPPPVIEGRGLRFGYGGAQPLFTGVDLQVGRREIVCLLGESGGGKSSLLRLLAGLEQAQGGSVHCNGQPLHGPRPEGALVFQQPSLLPWLDVAGNVAFGLDFRHQPRLPKQQQQERVAATLAAVGLAGKERLYPSQLSGGMAQRVALARALARRPQVLFADEPFSALDALTRADMQDLLVDLVHRWDSAVLFVTHDIDEALRIADRIVLLAGQPAGIAASWTLPTRRPREADGENFARLRLEIWQALHRQRRPADPAPRDGDLTNVEASPAPSDAVALATRP
jgi:NitT/TauT family transport system ATP-binding protein